MISWLVNMGKIKRGSFRSLPLSGVLILLCIIAMLSGFRVFALTPAFISIGNFIWFFLRLVEYVSVYFIVGTINFSNKERNSFFTLVIVSGAAVAVVSFLQNWGIIGVFPATPYIVDPGALTATFSFKTEFGAVAVSLALLVFDKIIGHKWNWLLGLLLLGCFSVMLLISQSRSAWVAFLVSFAVYLFSIKSLKTKITWAIVLLVAGFLFIGIESNQKLYQTRPIFDFETWKFSQDEAVTARLTSLPIIFDYLSDKPEIILLGVGFMNWRYTLSSVSQIYGGHNNYLTALAELGVTGLIAFLLFLARGFLTAWKSVKRNQPYSQFYLALLVGLCAACFFEDIFWPAVAQESFLAFFMFISALSLPSGLNQSAQAGEAQ